MSLSLLPGALLEGNTDIQCCAEELEAQAKLLEDEWWGGFRGPPPPPACGLRVPCSCPACAAQAVPCLHFACRICPSQPPAVAAAAAKAQRSLGVCASALGAPATRHGSLETVQRQPSFESEEQQERQQQQQQQQQAAESARADECCGEAAGVLREQPVTPQRHSKGDSCWSESPLPGSLEELAEVQSPGGQQVKRRCCSSAQGWRGQGSVIRCVVVRVVAWMLSGQHVVAFSSGCRACQPCSHTSPVFATGYELSYAVLFPVLCHSLTSCLISILPVPLQPLMPSSRRCPALRACLPPALLARWPARACRRCRWPSTTRSACVSTGSLLPPAPGAAATGALGAARLPRAGVCIQPRVGRRAIMC